MKQAELASLDTSLLKAKIEELEGTISGKDNIIALFEEQANMSLKKFIKLRQTSSQISSDTQHISENLSLEGNSDTTPPHSSFNRCLSSTKRISSSSSPTEATEKVKFVDKNQNLLSESFSPNSLDLGSGASANIQPESLSNLSSPRPAHTKDNRKFCQNCVEELPDDFD